MALQNVRALMWRAEDVGFGNGNTHEYQIPVNVPAAARPVTYTRAFVGSVDVTASLAATSPWATTGKLRIIVNRNPRYFLTVSGTMYPTNTSSGVACSFPLAPLQAMFLPVNVAITTVVANSTWPVVQPLSGSPGAIVPLATSTNSVTFDVFVEN